MGVRFRACVALLAACALAAGEGAVGGGEGARTAGAHRDVHRDAKDADNFVYQYEDYEGEEQEVLFNEDRPCPRDCTCAVSQGYRIARCNRLELGVQKFGDDITDLVIEHAAFPLELGDFVFKQLGLHQVATVKIVNTTITSVSPDAFHGLHELYAVTLANNKLKYLHPETFATNKKLLVLTLANNPFNVSASPQEYFLNASSVQELDLSYCGLRNITAATFEHMPSVMYLNVAGNDLSDMDPDTFKKLLDLEELDLSDNEIKSLPEDIFSENTELATLHILKNPIDTVYGLQISDLLTLNAGQTKIQFIGPSMFNGMTYIANLNLSGNSIEKIHNQAFHRLVELNYLDLSYNDLDYISSMLIKENIELDIFKISNNPRLRHLPANGFECSADQFNIYLFDASNCGLEEISDKSLQTFTALSVINLSDNKIKTISNKVFSLSPKLIEINLANNLLTTLNPKVFEKNNALGKLNLQGNPLAVFSAEVFEHTPLLTWLDMSHAELTTLWKPEKNHTAKLLANLTFLNVSHNRISEIKQNELNNLNKLRTIDVTNNPLVCNLDFENLMTWLGSRKVSASAVPDRVANLGRAAAEEGAADGWQALTRRVCGPGATHRVQPLPAPVSDEEIWERIDTDDAGNFDLKNTLDDGKLADDTPPRLDDTPPRLRGDLDDDIDDKDDDADDKDDDDKDDDSDEDDEEDDEEDEDDAAEDTADDDADDVKLNVKLVEKPAAHPAPAPAGARDAARIDIKLLDDMYDELEPEYEEVSARAQRGRLEYVWPVAAAALGALLLLLLAAKALAPAWRARGARYSSALVAAAPRHKKDCGLVYQPLSEDLPRYQPAAARHLYESGPLHSTGVVPEHV